LTPTAVHGLSFLYDDLNSCICLRLLLCLGLSVVITQKHGKGTASAAHVTTGTMGTVVRIVWPPSTHFTPHFDEDSQAMVTVPSQLPTAVQVLVRGKEGELLVPGLLYEVVEIEPFCKHALGVTIHPSQRPFKPHVVQLPMAACFSLVVDKVQGLMLQVVVIGNLRRGRRSSPRNSLYVAITK
jgi:hypothetical protein